MLLAPALVALWLYPVVGRLSGLPPALRPCWCVLLLLLPYECENGEVYEGGVGREA